MTCMMTGFANLHRRLLLTAAVFCAATAYASPEATIDSMQLSRNYGEFSERMSTLIEQTLSANHSIKASEARIREADAAVRATAGQEPPRFGIEAMDARTASFPNPLRDQMRMEYSLEQMIMYPGRLRAMRRAESGRKEMAQSDREALRRELVYKVKSAYVDLYLVDRQTAINRASRELLAGIVESARVRYETGGGMVADLLRAQTELATIEIKAALLAQRRRAMTAMINTLRAVPVATAIDTTPEVLPPAPPAPERLDTLLAAATGGKPSIAGMRAAVAMKKAELAVAKLEWVPDFMVQGTYSDIRPLPATDPMSIEFGTVPQANPDRWSLMLGITIPEVPWVLKKAKSMRMSRRAAVETAEEELSDMVNMTCAEVYSAFDAVQSSAARMRTLAATVLPQAELAFESALAAYKTGGGEFTMLLDAQRMLLMAREEYQMIVMEYLTALAALEFAAGVDINPSDGNAK